MSTKRNRAEVENVVTNKEYRVILLYKGLDIDPCYCDYAKHNIRLHWLDRPNGYKRPVRKHNWRCRKSEANYDSWKLHRKTQWYR